MQPQEQTIVNNDMEKIKLLSVQEKLNLLALLEALGYKHPLSHDLPA